MKQHPQLREFLQKFAQAQEKNTHQNRGMGFEFCKYLIFLQFQSRKGLALDTEDSKECGIRHPFAGLWHRAHNLWIVFSCFNSVFKKTPK